MIDDKKNNDTTMMMVDEEEAMAATQTGRSSETSSDSDLKKEDGLDGANNNENINNKDTEDEEDEIIDPVDLYPVREFHIHAFKDPISFNPLVSGIGCLCLWALAIWCMGKCFVYSSFVRSS